MHRLAKQYRLLFLLGGACIILMLTILPTAAATNLLTNGGFNNLFSDTGRVWRTYNEKIANGWNYFYLDANTYDSGNNAPKLHWMSSAQFASAFGGLDYHIEGDQAQNLWSSYAFDAGVYQQVTGVTPGSAYQFDIKMVTYWRGPGYPDTNGKMEKQVGIDPYGGTDATSSNIIWSTIDSNDKAWVGMQTVATAESMTMTVFAKVKAPENTSSGHSDLDMVYFEDSRLEQNGTPPTAVLNLSNTGIIINFDTLGSSAGGGSALSGYEVEYKEQSASSWTPLQAKTNLTTSGSFSSEANKSYTVRARAWQNNSNLTYPGQWVEKNISISEIIIGQVTNHGGIGLNDVTVSISGTMTTTTSASSGNYSLDPGSPGTYTVVAQDYNGLVAPPATAVTVLTGNVGTLNITLRPTGTEQGLTNNDFENDLSGWNVSTTGAAASAARANHTGSAGLHISQSVTISQTNPVTGMRNPMLSFWYKSNSSFTVDLLGEVTGSSALGIQATESIATRNLGVVLDWTYVTLDMSITDIYTGDVGAAFTYSGGMADIAIDEVSLTTGFHKKYLPIVVKN